MHAQWRQVLGMGESGVREGSSTAWGVGQCCELIHMPQSTPHPLGAHLC